MDDFVFGPLATSNRRLDHARQRRQGVQHQHRIAPRAPQAGDSPVVTVTVGCEQAITAVFCHLTLPNQPTQTVALQPVRTEWDLLNWQYQQIWQGQLPPQPTGTLVRYTIAAQPRLGEPILADDGAVFSYYVGSPDPPDWAVGAIVYQIFPDRFYPGNGRSWNPTTHLSDIHGGTLRGIIEQLDYVADMGFNTIWLNPFFPDHTHHGYHASDYLSVNPRLGTLADVVELVDQAHQRGIRLLLDFVANHWGSQHPTFQAARADRHSPYHDWYKWEQWPDRYATFFGVADLPELNVDNPAVRDHLFQVVGFWLGDVGFDGLRLDYALGPSHDFWTELRAVVKQIKPDAWIFGEAVQTPEAQLTYIGRFDGCLDFLLAQALRDTFAAGRMSLTAFDAFLHQHETYFPPTFSRPSFLDNHDMNRFLWLAGNDTQKLKLAALCQFTLSGSPIVYNGTEVGVSQRRGIRDEGSHGMEESRQPMRWGTEQNADLRDYFRWLIGLRREGGKVWSNGRLQTHHLNEANQTYAYSRSHNNIAFAVAFNLSDATQTIPLAPNQTITLPPRQGTVKQLS